MRAIKVIIILVKTALFKYVLVRDITVRDGVKIRREKKNVKIKTEKLTDKRTRFAGIRIPHVTV